MIDGVLDGSVAYSQDREREGMLHAAFVRSPHPHALVESIDASELAGECIALLPEDVADLGPYGFQIRDQRVLAERPRFVGDIVAAVAAPTDAVARENAARVQVSYRRLTSVLDPISAVSAGASLVHDVSVGVEDPLAPVQMRPVEGTNVCHCFRIRHGDVDHGFEIAEVTVEETFRTAAAQHAPMEPHATLAAWEDGDLTLWTGSQTPFNVRTDLAQCFGLAEERIRVIVPPIGGSFGAKTFVRLEAVVAALARKAGRPVRAILDRAEMFATVNRHPTVIRTRLAARGDGALVAKEVDCWADTGAYADCGPGVATKMGYAGVGPYRIPNVRVDASAIYTNLPPNGAFRGYGATQSVWASERTMDVLAERLGISPLELRRRNLLRDGDRFATGEVMHDVHFEECLQAAADAIDFESDPAGKGLSVVMKGMQTPSRAAIEIERTPVGYELRCASVEMGQGIRESLRLMGAELLGCEPGQIRISDPDTASAPFDTRTTSSRSTHMMGRALEAAVRDLESSDGDRGFGEVDDDGGLDSDTGQGLASTHWHQGACAAHVDLDDETGQVAVRRLHAAIYAGRVVDRAGAELQNEGSMIMGLGTALFEEIEFAEGQVTNGNLSDYNLPAAGDLPALTHDLIERDGAEIHGLGETALPPVPPAIGNAIQTAGAHVTELPMNAERILDAIDERDGSGA